MDGAQFKNCGVCNKDIHRSWFAKHLKPKLHEKNEKITPTNFFNEPRQPQQQAQTVPSSNCANKEVSERKNQSLK